MRSDCSSSALGGGPLKPRLSVLDPVTVSLLGGDLVFHSVQAGKHLVGSGYLKSVLLCVLSLHLLP